MSSPQVTDVDADSASFPQFIRLPLELRLIIWEMAMDEPRSIRILKDPYPKPRTLSVGEDNYYDALHAFCCGNTRVELHDWLLSLLSDGCISNPKSGFQLCRHYVYREMRDISISIDDPFLTLRNPNPQPELSYEDRCRIEDKCRIC